MSDHHPAPTAPSRENDQFLSLLPGIHRRARWVFGRLSAGEQEEALQEISVHAFLAYRGLCRRGLAGQAFPSTLALFAIRRYRSGRRIGQRNNSRDAMSEVARCGRRIQRIDLQRGSGTFWHDDFVAERRTPIPEIVCFRIDFSNWFSGLPLRAQQIVRQFIVGETPAEVAHACGISQGRVSQIRSELRRNWEEYQAEAPLHGCPAETGSN